MSFASRLALLLCCIAALFATQTARAQMTVVDIGVTNTFTANAAATNFSWMLDGIAVGGNSNTYAYTPQIFDVGQHYLSVNQTFPGGVVSNSFWGVRVRLLTPAAAVNYYVATNGSDANAGSLAAPFRTLEKARDTVRGLARPLAAGGVTVWLRGGTYWRTNTLMLTNALDSGSATAPVVWRGYSNETVVISAGRAIAAAAWTPLNSSQTNRVFPGLNPTNIWELDIAATGVQRATNFPAEFNGWTTLNVYNQGYDGGICELIYNGQRQFLSRYPSHNLINDDLLTTNMTMDGVAKGSVPASSLIYTTGTFQDSTNYLNYPGTYTNSAGQTIAVGGAFLCRTNDVARFTRWQSALTNGGFWLQGYWRVAWQIDAMRVIGFDVTNRTVLFATNAAPQNGIASKYSRPNGDKTEPYWALNLLEEMEQPGEWAIDFNRSKIYFYAPGPLTDGSVVMSDFGAPIVQVGGSVSVSNVVFQGLNFQAGLAQGILITNGFRNLVLGSTFRNMGNVPVEISNGGTNGVVSCNLADLAGGGVFVRGGIENTNPALRVGTKNFIVNNVITNFSRVPRVYAAAVDTGFFGAGTGSGGGGHIACVGNRVAGNNIAVSPHAAVLHGSWDNLFEYNQISQFQQISEDLGAFYSYDYMHQHGNQTFRYNLIHDSPLGSGIDFDQDGYLMQIYGNVMNLNTVTNLTPFGYGVVYRNYNQGPAGKQQTVNLYNNLFANTRVGAVIVSPLPAVIQGNASVQCITPFTWQQVVVGVSSNTFVTSTQSAMQSAPNAGYSYDPGFINLTNDDMRLRPDSTIFNDLPTFQQSPVELIGLFNDEYRTNILGYTPYVLTTNAVNITATNAVCSGQLFYPQFAANTTVTLYHGLTNGGTNAGAWQSSTNLGIVTQGTILTFVGGLQPNSNYYFRYYAQNPAGGMWSPASSQLITPPPPPFTTFTNLTASQTILSGTASVALSGQVFNTTPIYPTNGEVVTVTINGVQQTAFTTNNNGSFSLSFNTAALPAATGSYPITYAYAGSTNLSGNTNTLTSLAVVSATLVWNGASGTNFETGGFGGNWTDFAAPINDLISCTALFSNPPTTNLPSLTTSRSVRGLSFTSTNGGWRLASGSNSITLGLGAGGVSTVGQIAGTNIISAGLVLGANQNWQVGAGGTLLLTGSLTDSSPSTNWQATINNSGAGGNVVISPSAGNSVNLVGSNNIASIFQIKNSGTLIFGGDGVNSPLTSSTNFVLNTGTNFFGAIGLNAPGKIQFNSGTWTMSDLGKNGTDRLTGNLEINGGLVGFGGARYLGEGLIQVNGGTLRIGSDTTTRFSNGGRLALGSTFTTAGSAATMNVIGGFVDLAIGAGNTFGQQISTLFNQSGGVFQNGVTLGTGGAVATLTIGGTGTGTTNNLTALTLTDGTFISGGTVQAAGATGPGSVNNFNFMGGTLAVAAYNCANLGSSPTASAVANQTNVSLAIGTLANYGGTLAPGNLGVPGRTTIIGNYAVSNTAAALALDLGGTNQANAFQNGATNYDFVSVSGNTTLGGNLVISLINNFTPAATNSFTVLTNGGTLTASFANVVGGRVAVTNINGGSFRVVTNSTSVVLSNYVLLAASFTASTNTGTAPLTVTFTDNSTGLITNRFWSFSDGFTTNTTATSLTRTFTTTGTNLATLIVRDALASSTNSLNIVVTGPTQPPTIGEVSLSGTSLIITGTNGTAGANYLLLGATNLTLPMTNWTILSTNQFGPGGSVNVTNPLDPAAPQWFYRLRLP